MDDNYVRLEGGLLDEKEALDENLASHTKAMRKLKTVAMVTVFLFGVEMASDFPASTIEILTDSSHLTQDMVGFVISMVALHISMRPACSQQTFGWQRVEIVGAIASILFLMSMTLWLVVQATKKYFGSNHEDDVKELLLTSLRGVLFNLIQMTILYQWGSKKQDREEHGYGERSESKKERRNIILDATYLYVLGDMLMSIGVLISSLIIYYNENLLIAEPICTYVFAILVGFVVYPTLADCMMVLLEGVPVNFDRSKFFDDVRKVEGVTGVSKFHIW